jgi:short-subunit dehydrogenase
MIFKPSNTPIKDWSGCRVWLVGASSGIGAALAQDLLSRGAHVVVSARREETLKSVVTGYTNGHVHAFDVMQAADWPIALAQVEKMLGEVDLVVLGAARYDPQHSWEIDLATVRASYDLNVVSMYTGLHTLVPYLLKKPGRGVAIISSISGYTGLPRAMVYGATKAALKNLTETLYFELAPKGVSVYLINPGFVKTPMTAANDFHMPSLISPQQAAQAIRVGFEKGRFEIAFPKAFATTLRWVGCLPYKLRFWLLHRMTNM